MEGGGPEMKVDMKMHATMLAICAAVLRTVAAGIYQAHFKVKKLAEYLSHQDSSLQCAPGFFFLIYFQKPAADNSLWSCHL